MQEAYWGVVGRDPKKGREWVAHTFDDLEAANYHLDWCRQFVAIRPALKHYVYELQRVDKRARHHNGLRLSWPEC